MANMSIKQQIGDFLNRAALAEADAMALQDFDKLERLVIVRQDHHATAIASRLEVPDAAPLLARLRTEPAPGTDAHGITERPPAAAHNGRRDR